MSDAELLGDWLIRAKRKTHAHALAAARAKKLRLWIGVPATVLSAIVGVAVFAEIGKSAGQVGDWTKWVVVGLVLYSAALSGVQAFCKFGESEQLHNCSRIRFSKLRRKTEMSISLLSSTAVPDVSKLIEELCKEFDSTMDTEPTIPKSSWEKAQSKYPR